MKILRDYLEEVALYSNRMNLLSVSSKWQVMVTNSFFLSFFILFSEDAVTIVSS
jgi:hypothetical protein